MAYKKAETNSFAQYQLGEGFGSAVTGDVTTKVAGRTIRNAFDAQKLNKIKGYEGYPASYEGMGDDSSMTAGDLSTRNASHILKMNAARTPAGVGGIDLDTEQSARSILNAAKAQGYHGYEGVDLSTEQSARSILNAAKAQGYHGYESGYQGIDLNTEQSASSILRAAKAQGYDGYSGYSGVEDDAFAGYSGGYSGNLGQVLSLKQASEVARENKISDDVNEFSGFDGFGQAADLDSWHTFFHKATLAKTDTDMLSALKKAVKAVPDDTPASVKRSYYDTAMKMMKLRKDTDLRYIDINRIEIEANLGWLVNPNIPKTGGFDAMLNKVIGSVGAKLGKGDKDDLKMKRNQSLGRQLKEELEKTGQLGDFAGLDSKYLYIGLGILGVGAAYWYYNKNKAPVVAAKRKKKK